MLDPPRADNILWLFDDFCLGDYRADVPAAAPAVNGR